ncbi:MAG: MerR family transcriptional regulator [Clostridiales bacterium]|nr:MerR family transcriptional regulator [Clostridiales bacterium]
MYSWKERYAMSLNTIREVTEITGITVNALRYYDSKGLLHPTVRNSEGRKEWLYDDDAVRRAKRILLLRRIGIPVESIALVIEKADNMGEVILRSRLEELREERKEIDEQISVASMLLLIDELSTDAEVRDDLLDKMFEKICLDE